LPPEILIVNYGSMVIGHKHKSESQAHRSKPKKHSPYQLTSLHPEQNAR